MGELKSKILLVCVFVLLFGAAPVALGDWDVGDGHKMHYPQLPKPGGLDVALWSEGSVWLVDDWQCSQTGPVEDIHFWVSWEQNNVSTIGGFSVRIWSDDPCGPNGYSEPNELLWERDFDAGQFTVRNMPDDLQGWFDPFSGMGLPDDHFIWQQINIVDIIDPWIQKEGKIYWLMIDMWGASYCGWKESGSPHFRDNGVYWDGLKWVKLVDPMSQESLDLAFVITGPEEDVKHKNLKWSQPPIEWDPNADIPTYCGWDEVSYLLPVGTAVYQNWDANQLGLYVAPGALGFLPIMGDNMTLAGALRKLDYYEFAINSPIGTAPYTVTSELYTEVIDPCTGWGIPGAPIPGTLCNHNVAFDGYGWLTCSPGSGAILPDNVWMVLSFSDNNAGWHIAEQAELGYSGIFFALDDGTGWGLYWYGGNPQASCEANIFCETVEGMMAADDYRCLGSMPVTSIHWWGSHLGWEEPGIDPPDLPIAWRIGFWSNVPAEPTADPNYSYPEELLWQIEIPEDRVDVEEVGIDEYPEYPYYDVCYQYYLDLEPNEIFWQGRFLEQTMDDIFWLSIAAIYDPCVEDPQYLWGWKTRPWSWMDDGVRFWVDENLVPGMVLDPGLNMIEPIIDPVFGESFDLAFELDTDPNYVKHEQPFTGIRDWPHYEDEMSMAMRETRSKWWQWPDPVGWDVAFEYAGGPRLELADDWQCDETGTIDDIHFWLSWENDFNGDINAVTVKIYSNDPCGPGYFSEPNELKWSRRFSIGQFSWMWYGSGSQGWLDPFGDYWDYPDHIEYYYLSIDDINDPFIQQEGTIYWLSIELEVDRNGGWAGWKTTISPWQDVAVWRAPGASWQMLEDPTGAPLELAFELTTSELVIDRLVADDWPCDQNTPITAAVWWGSYIGYRYAACDITGPWMDLPVPPDYFWLNIWTDVPADSADPTSYSHPNDIIWEYKAYDYDEVLVGYDKHPEDANPDDPCREPVFRYSVQLPREAWFFQDEPNNVYWFGVVAVYENEPNYPWGWTNHKHVYHEDANDDAVEGYLDDIGIWSWAPLYDQTGVSEDMSFILFTDPDPTICTCWELFHCPGQPVGDATCDGSVNIMDILKVKQSWMKSFGQAGFNQCADFDHNCSVNIMDVLKVKQNWMKTGLGGDNTTTPPATCP